MQRFPSFAFPMWFRSKKTTSSAIKDDEGMRGRKIGGAGVTMSDSEYVSVGRETSSGSSEADKDFAVNGEKVEMEMARERKIQLVRTVVSGIGFMMGVVGIWGDGA